MKRLVILAAALALFCACAHKAQGPRTVEDFNFDWRFTLGDSPFWAEPGFDDADWRSLHLPHDWSIEGEFSPDNPSGTGGGALPGGIGWYRKHFETPDGVADGFGLFQDRDVRLPVGVHSFLSAAAHIDEEFGFVQIFPVPGHGVELGQGHLGDLMPGHTDLLPLSGTDLAADAVGVSDGDVQEVALTGGAIMGHGALDQMTEVIEFVAVLDLHPALCS